MRRIFWLALVGLLLLNGSAFGREGDPILEGKTTGYVYVYSTSAYPSGIAALVSTIGSTDKATIWFRNTSTPTTSYTITACTIPANINLRFDRGAMLSVGSGVTVTIAGGIEAGPWQIFNTSGGGSVVISNSVDVMYAEWWGAVAGDGSDDTAAIQAAVTCAARHADGHVGVIRLLGGTYNISSTITSSYGYTLVGSGNRDHPDASGDVGTYLYTASDITMFQISASFADPISEHVTIKDLYMAQAGSSTKYGVYGATATNRLYISLENVGISSFYHGVYAKCRLIMNNCSVANCDSYGVYAACQDASVITNSIILNNGSHGVYSLADASTGIEQSWICLNECEIFGNNGWGVYAQGGLEVNGGFYNNDHLGEIYVGHRTLSGTSGPWGHVRISNVTLEYAGYDDGADYEDAWALKVVSGTINKGSPSVIISDVTVTASSGGGVYIDLLTGATSEPVVLMTNVHVHGVGCNNDGNGDTPSYAQARAFHAVDGWITLDGCVFNSSVYLGSGVTCSSIVGCSIIPFALSTDAGIVYTTGQYHTLTGNYIGSSTTGAISTGSSVKINAINNTFSSASPTISLGASAQYGTFVPSTSYGSDIQVYGSSTPGISLNNTAADGVNWKTISYSDGVLYWYDQDAATNRMALIESGGTAPDGTGYDLTVYGDIRANGQLAADATSLTPSYSNSGLKTKGGAGNPWTMWGDTNNDLRFTANTTDIATFTDEGTFKISKSSTGSSFPELPGIELVNTNTYGTSFAGIKMSADNGGVIGEVFVDGNDAWSWGYNSLYFRTTSNHNIVFGVNNGNKRMVLATTGHLYLDGDYYSNGIFCCDYVFGDSYELLTLDELKSYVGDEGQLPGMTINKGGKLSMNKSVEELVIKTEEQALYILQLHDRLKKLEETIVQMQKGE